MEMQYPRDIDCGCVSHLKPLSDKNKNSAVLIAELQRRMG